MDGDARGESQLREEGRRGRDHDKGGETGQHGETAERQEGITDAVRDPKDEVKEVYYDKLREAIVAQARPKAKIEVKP